MVTSSTLSHDMDMHVCYRYQCLNLKICISAYIFVHVDFQGLIGIETEIFVGFH